MRQLNQAGDAPMTQQLSPLAWTGFILAAAFLFAVAAAPIVTIAAQIVA